MPAFQNTWAVPNQSRQALTFQDDFSFTLTQYQAFSRKRATTNCQIVFFHLPQYLIYKSTANQNYDFTHATGCHMENFLGKYH